GQPNTLHLDNSEGGLHFEGHAPLRGVAFMPHPECESVWLTFTPDGVLQSLFTLQDPTFTASDADYPWNRVKTGFDGPKTHLAICKLLRFLEKKYFADLQVLDESGYWQHGDQLRFESWMTRFTQDSRMLEEELEALQADESLGPEKKKEIIYRLFRQFGERSKPAQD
ncbi:MAG: hypothetical protein ABIQ93_04225, partial [Saprospiraceae bacterium]